MKTKANFWILMIGCALLQILSFFVIYNYWLLQHHRTTIEQSLPRMTIHTLTLAKSLPFNTFILRAPKLTRPNLLLRIADKPLKDGQQITTIDHKQIYTLITEASGHLRLSMPLTNAHWLNIVIIKPESQWFLFTELALLLGLIIIAIILLSFSVARRMHTDAQNMISQLITDRTQMLAAISHDLRTPITRLKLRAESISEHEEYRKIINDLNEMEHMITSILAFAKHDYLNETPQDFDWNALLASICDDMVDAGYDVSYEESERIVAKGRIIALKRAISNLIENAIKYGKEAKVSLQKSNNWLHIRITDKGPGIPADQQQNVFLPFYRIDSARTPEKAGSGLGLTVANDIIRAHSGEIRLLNLKTGGLCVTIDLPTKPVTVR